MTKRHSTKRSLIASILILCLCLTSFVGTTFAWFTDSVTSANNIIKSGNLDIELEYAIFNADGSFKEWKDVSGASDILTNTLWEPGVTEVAYLRVANAGSLALKYLLGVNIVSEKEGVNAAGNSFRLSDYIQFGVVEDVNGESAAYADRVSAVKALTDSKKISAGYSKSASLQSLDELYLALVVYMPETVGNEANHNGVNAPEIQLGINVLATQLASESDSFGNDYDKAAPWMGGISQPEQNENGVFEIGSAEELAWFAQYVNGTLPTTFALSAPTGHNAVLTSDIDLNNLPWTPIGHTLTAEETAQGHHPFDFQFKGTSGNHAVFDGNGHTVYNLNVEAKANAGLFGAAVYAKIKNVNVDGAVVASNHFAGTILAQGYARVENCNVKNSIVTCKTELVNGSWDNGDKVGGVVGKISEAGSVGTYGVIGCSAENVTVEAYRDAAGILGFAGDHASVTGNSVKGLTLVHNTTHDYKAFDSSAKYNVNAVVGDSTRSTGVYVADNTYEDVDISEIQIVYIYNLNDFTEFGKAVNSKGTYGDVKVANNTKVVVELMADIDMTNAPAIQGTEFAIGNGSDIIFKGTFDGNGHTISNYSIEAAWGFNVSLFRTVAEKFTMKDITFDNCSAIKTNNREEGLIVGTVGSGTIIFDNVDVKNSTVSGYRGSAVYVGNMTEGALYFIDCDVDNVTLSAVLDTGYNAVYLRDGYSYHDLAESGVFVENCTFTNCKSIVNGVEEATVKDYNYTK